MVFFYVCVFMLNSIVTSPFLQYMQQIELVFFIVSNFGFCLLVQKKYLILIYLCVSTNGKKKKLFKHIFNCILKHDDCK